MANIATKGFAIFKNAGQTMERIHETELGVDLLAIFPDEAHAEKVRDTLFNDGQHKIFKVEIP